MWRSRTLRTLFVPDPLGTPIMKLLATAFLGCTASLVSLGFPTSSAFAQLAERFDRFDRNGDGRVSRTELRRPRLFERLDLNDDGFVTRDEARGFVKQRRAQRTGRRQRAERSRGGKGPAVASGTPELRTHRYGPLAIQALDVYASPARGRRPVVIYVHGGAHVKGDKANVHAKAKAYTNKGYVFVSVNYRLGEAGRNLANVRDVASAVAWVKGNVSRYDGDASRMVLMGHSSGAQLAALVATDETHLARVGMRAAEIDAVVLLDTSQYDITAAFRSGALTDRADRHFRSFYGSDPAFWRRASPITHVVPGKPIAPMFVAAARRSSVRALSDDFARTLRRAGVPVERHDDRSKSHQGMNRAFGTEGDPTTQAAFRFLGKHLPS